MSNVNETGPGKRSGAGATGAPDELLGAERQAKTPAPAGRLKRLAFPLFIAALVLFALALVVQSSTTGGAYDLTLAELKASAGGLEKYVGKEIRVNGTVQAGSFRKMAGDKLAFRFTIGDAEGNQIDVLWDQLLPDAFEEGREVIVQGKLTSTELIHCQRLTVKCPSKYKDENAVSGESAKDFYKKNGKAPVGAPAGVPQGQAKPLDSSGGTP